MNRTLRGVWWRRGVLASLVAMSGVVVAGTVLVAAYADAAGSSVLVAAPLVLLGAVAVPALGRELASARREEVGLARLRGVRGLSLLATLVVEPALAVVAGLLVGEAVGLGLAPLVTGLWLPDPLGSWTAGLVRAALIGVAVAAVSLVAVVVAAIITLNEGLARQVSTSARPRRATTAVLLGISLAIVGGAVAVYRGGVTGVTEAASGQQAGSRPDLLVLLGPALVGLALGQVSVWVLRGLARVATDRGSGGRGLAGFLASRRVARADELTGPVRLVVAAGVVAVLATNASTSAGDWVEEQARIDLPGPAAVVLADGGAVEALAVSHRLDPAGDHLMAAVTLPGRDDLTDRRAYVDARRWESVAAATIEGSPAEPEEQVSGLATDLPVWAAPADRLDVEVEMLDEDAEPGPYLLDLGYVADGDVRTSTSTPVRLAPGEPTRLRLPLADCSSGCQPVSLTLTPGRPNGLGSWVPDVRTVRFTRLAMGDLDLTDADWVPGESARPKVFTLPGRGRRPPKPEEVPDDTRLVRPRASSLEVVLIPGGPTDVALRVPERTPALVADEEGVDPVAGFATVGGDERRVEVLARRTTLPLVGETGTLSDLVSGVWGSDPTLADARVMVVAGPGTPSELVDRVAEATGGARVTLEERRQQLARAAGESRAGAFVLMALACLIVALLAIAVAAARHQRSHRHDVAALRSVGVPVATARAAGRVELLALAALVAVAVVVGGWIAVRWLLPGMALVTPPPGALAFRPAPSVSALLGPAGLCALAVLLLGGRARRVRDSATRPAMLREERA